MWPDGVRFSTVEVMVDLLSPRNMQQVHQHDRMPVKREESFPGLSDGLKKYV